MPIDFNRVKEIFADALALHGEARESFLADACGGDAELRGEVQELLSASERTEAFLGDAAPLRSSPASYALSERPGQSIGPYKLLEQIGEGGFGSVFMAEQESPVRRTVALKVIKLGMDTRQVVARFEAERQALAMMDHPNVAKVLDAGATDAGRPYFVMELVRGVPVTRYCDDEKLGLRARLELFVQICAAIQHAHQKGLIHRDLKPTNVLVSTQDGRPHAKVIDFGIAKATEARLTEKTLFTEFNQLIGTPEYMSPEQTSSTFDIDTRSDVYSLGVMLYELLTGTTPFDGRELRSKAFAEIQRIIREVDPPAPSTRLSTMSDTKRAAANRGQLEPSQLNSLVRGELDWIVMRCLEKDRQRRYESTAALADDVRRYLADEPVLAGAPSRAYTLKKFLRRNRGPAIAAAAIALALVAGIIGTTIGLLGQARQRREAQHQAQLATEQAAIADMLSRFQSSMLRSADPTRLLGDKVTVLQVISAAAKNLDDGELKGQPIVEARSRETIGGTYLSLGRYREAEASLHRSIELYDSVSPGGSIETAAALRDLAVTLGLLGKPDESLAAHQRAIELDRKLLPPNDGRLGSDLQSTGLLLRNLGRLDDAEAVLRESLVIRRAGGATDDVGIANSLHDLALVERRRKHPDEAEKLLREALITYRAALKPDHPYIASCLHNLGGLMHDREHYAEAEAIYREALEIYRRSMPAGHSYTATTLNDLGYVLQEEGRFADALPLHREALESFRASLGDEHWNAGNARLGVGQALLELHRYSEAEVALLQAERVLRKTPLGDVEWLRSMNKLEAMYAAWDRVEPRVGHTAQAKIWRENLEKRQLRIPASTAPAAPAAPATTRP